MVVLLIVTVADEDSADDTLVVPVLSKAERLQALIREVLQVMVVVLPVRTRLGFKVRLVITPGSTQVDPPATWI